MTDGIIDIGVKEYKQSTTTGIFKNQSSSSFSIYPNPSQDILHLKSIVKGTMRIVDCNGNEYYSEELEAGENVFDIHQLHAGIYFVYISIKDETHVEKLVVIK